MKIFFRSFGVFFLCFIVVSLSFTQKPKRPELPSTLGLNQGFLEFDTPDFFVKIVKSSQTLAALIPKEAGGFDFTPT